MVFSKMSIMYYCNSIVSLIIFSMLFYNLIYPYSDLISFNDSTSFYLKADRVSIIN